MTLTIEIADVKQKSLEKIAAEKGKKINEFLTEIVDEYLSRNSVETKETNYFMKISETSFSEWENEEDAVYDTL